MKLNIVLIGLGKFSSREKVLEKYLIYKHGMLDSSSGLERPYGPARTELVGGWSQAMIFVLGLNYGPKIHYRMECRKMFGLVQIFTTYGLWHTVGKIQLF